MSPYLLHLLLLYPGGRGTPSLVEVESIDRGKSVSQLRAGNVCSAGRYEASFLWDRSLAA